MKPRDLVLIALSELDKGEETGNNAGPEVARYKRKTWEAGHNLGAWCASFVSWCLEECGYLPDDPAWGRKRHGAKWLYRYLRKRHGGSSKPEYGTVACWERGRRGDWRGHVGIVVGVNEDGTFTTIEGNRGGFPSRVAEFTHASEEGGLIGFARVC